MFNWAFNFISTNKNHFMDAAFIFAFGNLIVNTALDIAFHGLLRIRLASSPGKTSKEPVSPIDSDSSVNMDKIRGFINNF